MVSTLCDYVFFPKENVASGKSLGIPRVPRSSCLYQGNAPSLWSLSHEMSHFFSPSGKPLVKTSRVTVVNTKEPAVTVDIGGTVKTVRGVNVTISCQVAGEKFIHVFSYQWISVLGWGDPKINTSCAFRGSGMNLSRSESAKCYRV